MHVKCNYKSLHETELGHNLCVCARNVCNEGIKSSRFILNIKGPFHYLHKKAMIKEEGEERVSHCEHPADGASCYGFGVVVAGVAVPTGRQAAGRLTAADGATQVSKNTQARLLAYMCHIIAVIVFWVLFFFPLSYPHMAHAKAGTHARR